MSAPRQRADMGANRSGQRSLSKKQNSQHATLANPRFIGARLIGCTWSYLLRRPTYLPLGTGDELKEKRATRQTGNVGQLAQIRTVNSWVRDPHVPLLMGPHANGRRCLPPSLSLSLAFYTLETPEPRRRPRGRKTHQFPPLFVPNISSQNKGRHSDTRDLSNDDMSACHMASSNRKSRPLCQGGSKRGFLWVLLFIQWS
jgi:hypothetical protein